MAADPTQQQYLGTNYPVPTDANYYLQQSGLGSLMPQSFTQAGMASMFSPQSMQYTPANAMATNPFLQMYLGSNEDATRLQSKQV